MSKTGSSRMPHVSLWVCVFSLLCLKGFADFSSWNYGFVEFLSSASVGGSFFFQFFGVWWDWVCWWVATPSVHHGFQHNNLSVEMLNFILVERGLTISRNLTQKTRSEKQGDILKC